MNAFLTLSLNLQVVTIGKFQGGGAFNVIPDSVTIGGTFRAFSKESFEKLKGRITEVKLLNFILVKYRAREIDNIQEKTTKPTHSVKLVCFDIAAK